MRHHALVLCRQLVSTPAPVDWDALLAVAPASAPSSLLSLARLDAAVAHAQSELPFRLAWQQDDDDNDTDAWAAEVLDAHPPLETAYETPLETPGLDGPVAAAAHDVLVVGVLDALAALASLDASVATQFLLAHWCARWAARQAPPAQTLVLYDALSTRPHPAVRAALAQQQQQQSQLAAFVVARPVTRRTPGGVTAASSDFWNGGRVKRRRRTARNVAPGQQSMAAAPASSCFCPAGLGGAEQALREVQRL